MDNRDYSDTSSYRRGVVLGFTVAEIMLLMLFALLLALAGLLIKGRHDVQRATAVNEKFGHIISSLDLSDKVLVQKNIEKVIAEHVDYQKKVKEIEDKLKNQSLPDDVYEEIKSQKLDLSSTEGKQKFLDLLITALDAKRQAQKDGGTVKEHIESACAAGSRMADVIGSDKKPNDILNSVKDSKAKAKYWESQAAKCGLAGVLPPCYRESNEEPTPFIYDAVIKAEGIYLKDTIPEKYVNRFKSDFINPPPVGKPLSINEFANLTYQFLVWGQKNQCRFYVTAYDELPNEKDKFKQYLKAIEGNFYKRTTW